MMLAMIIFLILLSIPSALLLQGLARWTHGRQPEFANALAAVLVADIATTILCGVIWLIAPLVAVSLTLPIILVILLSVVIYAPAMGMTGPQGAITAAIHRLFETMAIAAILIIVLP